MTASSVLPAPKRIPLFPAVLFSVGLWAIALCGIYWCWQADHSLTQPVSPRPTAWATTAAPAQSH